MDWWAWVVIAIVVLLVLVALFGFIQRKRRTGRVIAADVRRSDR